MTTRAHLSSGGVDFVAEILDGAFVIRYWGSSISDLSTFPFIRSVANSDYDHVINPGMMREHSRGWLGYPTLRGHRLGKSWSSHFSARELKSTKDSFHLILADDAISLTISIDGVMDKYGALALTATIQNHGDDYTLEELWYWLPLPEQADESLDFVGRWSSERNPQRKKISIGRWIRDSHEGRSGHNFTIGQIALNHSTNFSSGQAWSVALKWSGDTQYCIEKNYEGMTSIGASEILRPGEIILAQGESYTAPTLIAGYSDHGLDGLSGQHHEHLRARNTHPSSPRLLTLNMWEAIYFKQSEEKVKALVDVASEIGVERVVLDDGWFGSRRSDHSGLGDWKVSPEVWPRGLKPIADYILSKGMQFGLWFEGEMVNPDSQLYREHPDWILSEQGRIPPTWRHELVIDLTNVDAYTYVLESISAVIGENGVSFIKWDHNRTLIDAGHNGRAAFHNQTRAIYRLFDELKRRHAGLEIESCASGGGRIDLGMTDHADRFWVSDNNDALERQTIQRWTAQFIPPELLGSHIGPTVGHQTGRNLALAFRAATALFGHAGIEWDITELSVDEKKKLSTWIGYYKSKRNLIHTGRMVRVDHPDEACYFYGVVSMDKKEALFNFAQLRPSLTSHPAALRFVGLDPQTTYTISIATPAGLPEMMVIQPPQWLKEGAVVKGDALMKVGLPAPILRPENALTIEVQAK